MLADRTARDASAGLSWEIALLVPAEGAPRNRRPSDVALVAVAAVGAGLAAGVAHSAPGVDSAVDGALDDVLGWAPYFWRLGFVLVLVLALVVAVDVIIRRRWVLARDLLLAVAIVAAAGVLLGRIVTAEWFQGEAHLFSNWG